MNENLNTVIIVPITSNKRKYPTRVAINKAKIKGMAVIDQLRTIGKKRITNLLGVISTKSQLQIKQVIKEMLVD